jgi:hypothetical protein
MSPRLAGHVLSLVRLAWRSLRQWSGDAAYETYLARANGGPCLSRKLFYLESLQRRYREPNRCC